MVRVSPKSANEPNEMTLTISNKCCRLMRDWELESLRNGKGISVPNEKIRLPLEVVYNFRSDFPQKFPFHFTFNPNFRIILLSGRHPNFPENVFKNCILFTKVVLLFLFRSEQQKIPLYLLNFPLSSLSAAENNCKW